MLKMCSAPIMFRVGPKDNEGPGPVEKAQEVVKEVKLEPADNEQGIYFL